MLQIQPGLQVHDHAGVVRGSACAVRCKAERDRVGLGVSDQALQILGRQVGCADHDHSRPCHCGNGHHIPQRVKRRLQHMRHFRQHVAGGDHDGLAVRGRGQQRGDGDAAAGARSVVDHHGLANLSSQLVGQQPGEHVHGPAGRSGYQHPDRLVGPGHGGRGGQRYAGRHSGDTSQG